MTSSTSPTVRRRRLAAELRRLRGNRTLSTVGGALGWSTAKVSRYELGQGSFPLEEIEKLLDYYSVAEPRRAQLLGLAVEANERPWWYEYADALSSTYMELIGLEAEAATELVWQVTAVPGLLQTEEYARAIHTAHQQVVVLDPPGVFERRVAARLIRQEVLTLRTPPLELSVVIDEGVLLRKVGTQRIMTEQLNHLAQMAELPNIELRILPLQSETSVRADSFLVFGFPGDESGKLGDVVSTEAVTDEIRIEGETDTHVFRLIFDAFVRASLSPEESRELILQTVRQHWSR